MFEIIGGTDHGDAQRPAACEMVADIEQHRDEVHASAFRDLEGEVCDLDRMAQIARELMMNCRAPEDEHEADCFELAIFAVGQFAVMAKAFRENYYERYGG